MIFVHMNPVELQLIPCWFIHFHSGLSTRSRMKYRRGIMQTRIDFATGIRMKLTSITDKIKIACKKRYEE